MAQWLCLLTLPLLLLPMQARAQSSASPEVIVLTFAGPVTPVLERYLTDGIRAAEAGRDGLVILQLDTPGGSVEVTQSIIQVMLASPVPIVVYVAPAGARAGSAGTFITLAGHIAAMAPNTSIGAASPVDIGGGEIDSTLAAKVTNILSADIENLAQRRGTAATEWAVAAVQEAAAATAQEAQELGVIDVIATGIPDLLRQIDGRTVTLPAGDRVLRTAEARPVAVELSFLQRILNFLVDPNLASILLSLGILSLVIEVRSPGFGVAGIFGLICILLAFYALGQLRANLAGLAFLGVALALFITEAFTPTFGILTVGGIIAFIFGGALLFDTPGLATPWFTLIALALVMGGLTLFVGVKAMSAQNRPALSGGETLIGTRAGVKAPFTVGEVGSVFVQGEWWNARLTEGAVDIHDEVVVVGRQGLMLTVTPTAPLPPPVARANPSSAPKAATPTQD
jgi:membrane-bound serine protease (ClpP class)